MGSVAQFSDFTNFIKLNNKIPHYAREYKKEYLFIRGLNKEFGQLKNKMDKMDMIDKDFFESPKIIRIKNFIKRFLRAQEKGRLKNISDFVIYDYDVVDKIIDKNFNRFLKLYRMRWDYFNDSDYEDNENNGYDGKNDFPGFKEFYDNYELFFSQINYKTSVCECGFVCESGCESGYCECECDCYSDFEDYEIIMPFSDESESESDNDNDNDNDSESDVSVIDDSDYEDGF